MKWAIIDPNGIVLNIIVYDGTSPITTAGGTQLVQVNDWIVIGQNQNTPEPSPPTPSPAPDSIADSAPPSVADQLASLTAALVNNNVLTASQIDPNTLAAVNVTLAATGQTAIAMPILSAPALSATPSASVAPIKTGA